MEQHFDLSELQKKLEQLQREKNPSKYPDDDNSNKQNKKKTL